MGCEVAMQYTLLLAFRRRTLVHYVGPAAQVRPEAEGRGAHSEWVSGQVGEAPLASCLPEVRLRWQASSVCTLLVYTLG